MWHSPASKSATRAFHFVCNELQSKNNMISAPPCQNETFFSNRKNTNLEISAKRKQRLKLARGSSSAESAYTHHANITKHSPCTITFIAIFVLKYKASST
jgi:hypothetical protein